MDSCGCDKADGPELSNAQLMALMRKSPVLDAITAPLSQELQAKLLILQQRAGNAYAGKGNAPSVQEAQKTLGQTYLALEDKKVQLKGIMDEMQLTPSSRRRGNWVEQIVENVKGMFR